jgi:hypothetical protein
VGGTDAIRYWDDGASDWSMLTGATLGTDYWLEYQTEGDLMGYTLLTVGEYVPDPGDLNADGLIDATDIDALAAAIQAGSSDLTFDLTGNEVVDANDFAFLVHNLVDTPMGQGTAMGDFNLDGKVGLLDLAVLGDGYNGSDGWAWGDANGDGTIGILDLGLLGDNYGFNRSAIPEPMTMSLLAIGALGMLKRRRA